MIGDGVHAAENVVRESLPLANRDGRERHAVRDVTDRVDRRHAALRVRVNTDLALRAELDTGLGQP